jgi:hypothetical protein
LRHESVLGMMPKLKGAPLEDLYLALRMNDKWSLKKYLRARMSNEYEGRFTGLQWLDGKIAQSELFRPWTTGVDGKDNCAVERGKVP